MATQSVEARYQVKDENGSAVLDSEGKAVWQGAAVDYDFGSNLDEAIALCGSDTVHSNYVANAKVALQGLIRSKLKAGQNQDQIAASIATWKPGMVMERVAIDPVTATLAAFPTWSPEKQREYLANLGVQV